MSGLASIAANQDSPEQGVEVARLWAAIDSDFLELLGWSAERRYVFFPQDHPVLGWRRCPVAACDTVVYRGQQTLCAHCRIRWEREGQPPMDEFLAIERIKLRRARTGRCAVPQCQRPWGSSTSRLCSAHHNQRVSILKVSLDQFVAHPVVVALPSFGPCEVAACARDKPGNAPYCDGHRNNWRNFRRHNGEDADEMRWRITTSAISIEAEASLRGLPDRVVAEILFGLQQRVAQGVKTSPVTLRPLIDHVRAEQVASIEEIDPGRLNRRFDVKVAHVLTKFVTSARLLRATPETERHKDEWNVAVFGAGSGTLRFDAISQSWLREAAKIWAANDLPRRRGRQAKGSCQVKIKSLTMLSSSLRLQCPDHGDNLTALSRTDITNFLNRIAFLRAEGTITLLYQIRVVRDVKQVLAGMRALGLTRPGQPLHGLHEDFVLSTDDIPDEPEERAGRDLPIEVMRTLCANLDTLEARSGTDIRVVIELMIDTGRRLEEICQLPLDCLDYDEQGQPVLVYDNFKANRNGRRLPINLATASVIQHQQAHIRARFPHEPAGQLKLLPRLTKNPHGTVAFHTNTCQGIHRDWVASLPDILVPTTVHEGGMSVITMLPFDKKRIFPHAYRHTYAQRHADAGVAVDVLRELMDHRQLSTTQGYYRLSRELHQTGENLLVA